MPACHSLTRSVLWNRWSVSLWGAAFISSNRCYWIYCTDREFYFSFGAREVDELSIAASEGGLEPSEVDDSAEPASLGATFQSEADAGMVAMLTQAAESIRLEWTPPSCSEHSRLDDWFRESERNTQPCSTPVPFFPEVHKKQIKSGKDRRRSTIWLLDSGEVHKDESSETAPYPPYGIFQWSLRPHREIFLSLFSLLSLVPSLWRWPSWLCSLLLRGFGICKPSLSAKHT